MHYENKKHVDQQNKTLFSHNKTTGDWRQELHITAHVFSHLTARGSPTTRTVTTCLRL